MYFLTKYEFITAFKSWPAQVFLTKNTFIVLEVKVQGYMKVKILKGAYYLMMIHPHAKDVSSRSKDGEVMAWLCFLREKKTPLC